MNFEWIAKYWPLLIEGAFQTVALLVISVSFGFVLAVAPAHAAEVIARFQARELACADIGQVRAGTAVDITLGEGAQAEHARLWDFASEGFLQPQPRAAGAESAP